MPTTPKIIYLDQSVLSHVAGSPGTDWRTTNWGDVVSRALSEKKGQVWASPTHVLEIALCADFDQQSDVIDTPKLALRKHLAQVLIEMIEARRMR